MPQVDTYNWRRFYTEEGRDMRKEATWMPSMLGSQEETAQPDCGGGPNAEWIILCLWNKIDLLHLAYCFLANLWLHAHGWKGQGPLPRMQAMAPPFVSPWSQTVACKLFFSIIFPDGFLLLPKPAAHTICWCCTSGRRFLTASLVYGLSSWLHALKLTRASESKEHRCL